MKDKSINKLMGTWVLYQNKLRKRKTRQEKYWITDHIEYEALRHPPRKAMIIGHRWLPEGKTYRYGEESWESDFYPTGSKYALVAVKDCRSNPIYLDPETVTFLDGTSVGKELEKSDYELS